MSMNTKTIEEIVNDQAHASWMCYLNDMGDDCVAFIDAVSDKFLPLLQAERAKSAKLEADAKETAEVVTALKKYIVQIEGERDKLVEALEEIQTTARGASGLGWRGNNIGNIAGRALEAHKEGESRD
jgi:ribosomal protein L11 methylase PrmA